MPNTTHSITDVELKNLLSKSVIDASQKTELQKLIPEMTDQERMELVALIGQSNEEAEKANARYEKKVGEINKEYEGKINKLVKETTESAYDEAEKAEAAENAQMISVVEGEIVAVSDTTTKKIIKKKGHALRNLFLIILFLLIIGGGALYVLQMLSTTK